MGELSEEQILELKDAFAMFDKSGSGTVEADQVVDILRAVGMNPQHEEADKTEKELGKKPVSFDSFLSLYVQYSKKPRMVVEDFIEGLRAFDRNMDGTVSAGQLRQLLTHLGDTLTSDEADVIVALEDNQGTVEYEKLVEKVMSM